MAWEAAGYIKICLTDELSKNKREWISSRWGVALNGHQKIFLNIKCQTVMKSSTYYVY